jgi:hypothetical protein
MSDRMRVRLRCLPEGEYRQALQTGGEGRFLHFDLADADGGFPAGSLLEIESGPLIRMGELVERRGLRAVVLIEHSIDRSRVPAMEETWV